MAKHKHRFRFGRLLILVLVVAGAYSALAFVGSEAEIASQLERKEDLLRRQQELQHELEYHENELDFIGSDEYIEQQARERLGWIRQNEIMYVDAASSAEPREKVSAEPTSTATVPGPRRTERPSSTPSSRATSAPSAAQSGSSGDESEGSVNSDESEENATESAQESARSSPAPSSTPKSIG